MTLTGNHIGTLIKPHGYKGEMLLRGNPLFLENLEPGTPLFIEIDELRVPFFIEELSLDLPNEKCIIKLEFINSDTLARKYAGCQVYEDINSPILTTSNSKSKSGSSSNSVKNTLFANIAKPTANSNATDSATPEGKDQSKGSFKNEPNSSQSQAQRRITLHISEYIGYIVIDTNSKYEYEIINYIDSPHNPLLVLKHGKEEILLPLNADYITETNTKNRSLKASFPDGLL